MQDKTQVVSRFYFCTVLYDPTYTLLCAIKILIDNPISNNSGF